jgi:hypothetical protein
MKNQHGFTAVELVAGVFGLVLMAVFMKLAYWVLFTL